jgi:hypothetical protein
MRSAQPPILLRVEMSVERSRAQESLLPIKPLRVACRSAVRRSQPPVLLFCNLIRTITHHRPLSRSHQPAPQTAHPITWPKPSLLPRIQSGPCAQALLHCVAAARLEVCRSGPCARDLLRCIATTRSWSTAPRRPAGRRS